MLINQFIVTEALDVLDVEHTSMVKIVFPHSYAHAHLKVFCDGEDKDLIVIDNHGGGLGYRNPKILIEEFPKTKPLFYLGIYYCLSYVLTDDDKDIIRVGKRKKILEALDD